MLAHFCVTQQGESHKKRNVPCQDYSTSRRIHLDKFDSDIVLAAIADGVGSCLYSQDGSKTAVETLADILENQLNEPAAELTDDYILRMLEFGYQAALESVGRMADSQELPFLEFDSTLTAAVFHDSDLWFGHIGDDGIVALYTDGSYEMITRRHKGQEAHSVFPLRNMDLWQFGKAPKPVASFALMTDGVLDSCVDTEAMNSRVFFPFLKPALAKPAATEEQVEEQRLDWDNYMANLEGEKRFRDRVTDDITFVVVQNSDLVSQLPEIMFDMDQWERDTEKRQRELDAKLYREAAAYKQGTYIPKVKKGSFGGASSGRSVQSGQTGQEKGSWGPRKKRPWSQQSTEPETSGGVSPQQAEPAWQPAGYSEEGQPAGSEQPGQATGRPAGSEQPWQATGRPEGYPQSGQADDLSTGGDRPNQGISQPAGSEQPGQAGIRSEGRQQPGQPGSTQPGQTGSSQPGQAGSEQSWQATGQPGGGCPSGRPIGQPEGSQQPGDCPGQNRPSDQPGGMTQQSQSAVPTQQAGQFGDYTRTWDGKSAGQGTSGQGYGASGCASPYASVPYVTDQNAVWDRAREDVEDVIDAVEDHLCTAANLGRTVGRTLGNLFGTKQQRGPDMPPGFSNSSGSGRSRKNRENSEKGDGQS